MIPLLRRILAERRLDRALRERRLIRRAESARASAAYWTHRADELRRARELFEQGNHA